MPLHHRRSAWVAILLFPLTAAAAAAQAPPPPEYDPGADRHFLLPTGRVAPAGTGSAGAGGLAWPSLASPYVSASPIPRVSVGATTLLTFGLLDAPPVVGSVTVQPVRYGPLDVSVTVAGLTNLDRDAGLRLGALFGSASYGSDVFRVTAASGSLGGLEDGVRFGALGIDAEIDRGEPTVVVVAGEPRTVRRRVKLVGEAYFPLEGWSEGAIGLLGLRFSESTYWVNVGVPFVVGGGGAGAVWLPIVTFGVAF